MATISTADFKNGMGLNIKGKYYTLVEFQHVKPGKGGAFVRYKIKDLRTGIERTDTQKVLDGDLDEFVEASLKSGLEVGAKRSDA
jgi:translation elongation factor P/translation initiation factor 5A